jgi:hypothetical protein
MSQHTILTIVLWFVFGAIWGYIANRHLTAWIAHNLFGMKANRHYKPFGKWYASTRGILHLKGDTSTLRWKTALATLIFWMINLPIVLAWVIWIAPRLAEYLAGLL